MSSRFGQLTYTSFDAGDGNPGGWQVKETVGDLTDHEIRFLTSRVGTQLDTGTTLPRFPTAEQVAALPHRLRHAAADELGAGATATWHTAPAGLDASGRPGNVFAHVVLDRGGDQPPTRPILTWRSPDWLSPYGVSQVTGARLTSTSAPGPGALDARAAAELIFAPRTGHLALLQVLLDATVAARDGGPPVVLGVANLEDAATWIAAVQLCMAPGTAHRHWFSTLERADRLGDGRRLGLQLMAVPVADLDALEKARDLVVLDAEEPVELGDLDGSPHRTQRGDQVSVTPWSVLVAEVLADAETFVRVTAGIDAVAATAGHDDLHPAWPLARMVADGWDADVLEEANRVLEQHSPDGFVDDSNLRVRTGDRIRRRVGGSTDHAWQRASRPAAGGVDAEVYIELALADDDWLALAAAPRIPAVTVRDPGDRVMSATLAACQRLAGAVDDPVVRVRRALYVLQLALAAGAAGTQQGNRALVQLCTRVILPGLRDTDVVGAVVRTTEYTISDAARGWLWSLLARLPLEGVPGQRLPADLVLWLAPRPDLGEANPLADTAFDHDTSLSPVAQEWALLQVHHQTASPETGTWAVCAVLDHAVATGIPPGQDLRDLLADWPATWLKNLHRRFGEGVPIEWLTPAMLRLDDLGLWHRVARRGGGKLARARLRVADTDWVLGNDTNTLMQNVYRMHGGLSTHQMVAPQIRNDTGRALAVAILGGQRPPEEWLTTVGAVVVRPDTALLQWAERIPEVTLLWWLLHGTAELELPTDGPWAAWLSTVQVAGGPDPLNLLETFLISRWHTHWPGRSAHDQADQWRVEAEQSGARFNRQTDRWLRSWAQRRKTW